MLRLATVLAGLSIGAAGALLALIVLASDLGAYRSAADRLGMSEPHDLAAALRQTDPQARPDIHVTGPSAGQTSGSTF